MALRLITPPVVEPLTPAEVRTRLSLDSTAAPDLFLASLIQVAREELDGPYGLLNRSINTQTWDLFLDVFPTDAIEVPLPPLMSVTSVNYIDANGDEQVLDPGEYEVDILSDPGWIVLSGSWPAIMGTINAVRVRFVSGYGDLGTDVPEPIRQWITMRIGSSSALASAGVGGALRSVTVEGVGSRTYSMSGSFSASYVDYQRSMDGLLTRYNRRIAYV